LTFSYPNCHPSHPALTDKPFLCNAEPMELEALPLQVALLTMELAALRQELWDDKASKEGSGLGKHPLVKPALP
jgi:hypothetical protein